MGGELNTLASNVALGDNRLRALARQRKTSVANLIRHAVRQAYLEQPEPVDRNAIAEEMLSLRLPLVEWDEAEKIVEDAHADVC